MTLSKEQRAHDFAMLLTKKYISKSSNEDFEKNLDKIFNSNAAVLEKDFISFYKHLYCHLLDHLNDL